MPIYVSKSWNLLFVENFRGREIDFRWGVLSPCPTEKTLITHHTDSNTVWRHIIRWRHVCAHDCTPAIISFCTSACTKTTTTRRRCRRCSRWTTDYAWQSRRRWSEFTWSERRASRYFTRRPGSGYGYAPAGVPCLSLRHATVNTIPKTFIACFVFRIIVLLILLNCI